MIEGLKELTGHAFCWQETKLIQWNTKSLLDQMKYFTETIRLLLWTNDTVWPSQCGSFDSAVAMSLWNQASVFESIQPFLLILLNNMPAAAVDYYQISTMYPISQQLLAETTQFLGVIITRSLIFGSYSYTIPFMTDFVHRSLWVLWSVLVSEYM